ncbi:macro domain-containing protein [Endozoicomonas atrinae]|uniref:macro domain-containing protein n=1 Tax=Endozoicomonas atrinae TaxID=1333660 RepID=UPI000824BF32|nr:macro domain-containing protein [Endozoicomonas atrinae]
MKGRIDIIQGDITTLSVDAIVNAANSGLLGGGGVDGAIHRAAGPELLAACREIGGCPTGEVRVTPAFRLPEHYVFHKVGPVWQGGDAGEPDLLRACYRNALTEASNRELSSVAFPAISCGVYGYPHQAASEILLMRCMSGWPGMSSPTRLYLSCLTSPWQICMNSF